MTAVLLALLTAASYGVANYLGPLLSRRLPLSGVLLVGQSVGVLGGLLLVAVTGFGSPGRSGLLLGAAAGTANAVALASFYRAAALGPISIVAPIGATGAVVPVLVGIVGGERPSLLQLVGIPLAVAGVALAAARQAPAADAAKGAGIGLSVFAAAVFGTFLALFAAASDRGAPAAVLTSRVALLVWTVLVVAAFRLPWRLPRRDVSAAAVPGLLLVVGTIAYGIATTRGLVSVVSVLATLSPVVTVGLAVLVLGERLAGRQRLGVAVALLGVVLLAAG
ncbi:MAG: EamA family transporter [Actinobacteria bacterium]|nr:EamA family transporter [Actinomycetota bacterium]